MLLNIAALNYNSFNCKRQNKWKDDNERSVFFLTAALNHFPPSVSPGNGITGEEEKLEKKVKPKPRSSTKQATSTKTTTAKTSKYFQSPVKEEATDSEDDFDMVTSPPPRVRVNAKKTEKEHEEEEEEEDSEEDDDDDWEEVEGKWGISRKLHNTFLSVGIECHGRILFSWGVWHIWRK